MIHSELLPKIKTKDIGVRRKAKRYRVGHDARVEELEDERPGLIDDFVRHVEDDNLQKNHWYRKGNRYQDDR